MSKTPDFSVAGKLVLISGDIGTSSTRRLPAGVSAINNKIASCEIAARVRSQIDNGARHLTGFSEPTHRRQSYPIRLPRWIRRLGHFRDKLDWHV